MSRGVKPAQGSVPAHNDWRGHTSAQPQRTIRAVGPLITYGEPETGVMLVGVTV
jgi:hypothetical protein